MTKLAIIATFSALLMACASLSTISPAQAADGTCSAQRGVKEYLENYVDRVSLPLRVGGEAARIELGRVATLGQLGNTLKCVASLTMVIAGARFSDTLYFNVTPTDDGESLITEGR